jgi:hypothetical protein
MNKKILIITGVVVLLIGVGVFASYGLIQESKKLSEENQPIDWKAEADKLFEELQAENNASKVDWEAETEKMLGELYDNNGGGEIDWLSENDKMLSDLIDQNNTDKVDWQAEADRMFEELQQEDKIDWQAETERMLAELEGLNENLDDTGLEADAAGLGSEIVSSNYIGTWRKTATSINGKAEAHAVSTIVLTKNSYEARTGCVVSGSLATTDKKMSVNITSDGCTNGAGPKSYNFDYQVSSDGKTLTLTYSQSGFVMIEKFEKVK